jgi:hypothetical protein
MGLRGNFYSWRAGGGFHAAYITDSNTLGHITGAILTSLPLGKGGFSPYSVTPTCLLQSGDHLFHDEVCTLKNPNRTPYNSEGWHA